MKILQVQFRNTGRKLGLFKYYFQLLVLICCFFPNSDAYADTLLIEGVPSIQIPVVNVDDFALPSTQKAFLSCLYHAMSTLGYFAVQNNGVSLEQLAATLQIAVIEAINVHATFRIPSTFIQNNSQLRISPLCSSDYSHMKKRMGKNLEHSMDEYAYSQLDMNILSIFSLANLQGLQLQVGGQWHNVIASTDAVIVQVGEALENMTNGLFRSIKYRILALEQKSPLVGYFIQPTHDTPLDPLPACVELTGGFQKYANGTCLEFLWERLIEKGVAPELLSLYAQTGHVERQIRVGRENHQVIEMVLQNNLATPQILDALEEKANNDFLMGGACGCSSYFNGSSDIN